jgi:proton-translocating NADH-quinone oxidoreductase chain L
MFDDPRSYLWLIPALPLLASILIAVFGYSVLREKSHWVCIAGAVGACVFSMLTLAAVADGYDGHAFYYKFFEAGNVRVDVTLQADGLTAVMLVTVTFIGSLIAIYSAGYMRHDPGYPRYFAEVSLFLFSMTGLVLANNFILLYVFWEGVGLCSYLLIGFWFAKPAAAAAARKAFLVTRLGDIGLFLGILLLWSCCGHSLEYDRVFEAAPTVPDHGLLVAACLLLFVGAAGKSAQFPLHVWLPDAMEGPSPVSALIHAATMVTAGVYLVARCMPLFGEAPEAQLAVACIGAFTALLAALIALTQTDLKRVLAYSTVSQLGFMFLALGSGIGAGRLAGLAVTAAIFHLFTHAFFKALLFLGAGSVMHSMGNVIDMRKFSGLRKVLPVTHWTFLCGSAALAGFPFLSGFWSKDEILAVAHEAGQHSIIYTILFYIALLTAGLTAFYTFRAYFKTFWGAEKIPHEAHRPHGHQEHAHEQGAATAEPAPVHAGPHHLESPAIMTWPLRILAVGALFAGLLVGPSGLFGEFLEEHWIRQSFSTLVPASPEHHHNYLLMAVSSLVALGGIAVAYLFYVKNPMLPLGLAFKMRGLYELSRNKFYIDELYVAFLVRPLQGLAWLARVVDQYLIDGLVDLIAQVPAFVGYLLRPIQNGLVQFYALLMALGLGGFLLSVLLR